MEMDIRIGIVLLAVLCVNQVVSKGCVQLDSLSFDKIISKFEAAIIKFDTAYPYGAKHEAFESVCETTFGTQDLLAAEVQVKDYGEKDNEDLAKRFNLDSKVDFPVLLLFVKGNDKPIQFPGTSKIEFSDDNIKRFIKSHTKLYIGLPGCLEQFDRLAQKLVKSKTKDERNAVMAEFQEQVNQLSSESEIQIANNYLKVVEKVIEKGDSFIDNEKSRITGLIGKKITNQKRTELNQRLNVLQSFSLEHDEL